MIVISLDTAVFCENSQCGIVYQLIVQPQQFYLTHLVVKLANQSDRVIPTAHIAQISDDTVWLTDNMTQVNQLPIFTETALAEITEADYSFEEYGHWYPGTSRQTKMYVPISHYNIPPGGLVINRQTQVEAKNGHVGQFKALIVDKDSYQVTYLVFKRGHLWERKQETVPVSIIDRLEGDSIYLNVNKSEI